MLGIITLSLALAAQIGYTAFCIAKNAIQPMVRSIMRITSFALLCLLLVLDVYEWGIRWIPLFLLLAVCTIASAAHIISKPKQEKPFRKSKALLTCIGGMLLLTICILPAILLPQYKLPKTTGEYEVASTAYTYIDLSRIEDFTDTEEKREVTVEFWYPENADGTYPLLVFSHGAFGVRASNTSTYTELASHGYVVCSIDHPYHSFYSASVDGKVTIADMGFMQEVTNANTEGVYTVEEAYGLIQKWMKLRTDDMNFIIDTILQKAESSSEKVYQLVDTDKIGVFGHSMGGAASVWLGRERDDITAVVNIDAPYFSELVYNPKTGDFAASNEVYATPLLNIYSDDVWVQLESNSTYAANKAADENCSEVYTAYFQGAKHMSLTDLVLFSPMFANMLQGGKAKVDKYYCIETMNSITLEFFDCYLKGEGSFTSGGTY